MFRQETRHTNMALRIPSSSREKTTFRHCIQGISENDLALPLCYNAYPGDADDVELRSEVEWIVSRCAEQDSLQSHPFSVSGLGLSQEDASAAIRAAPRSKEGQLRQAVVLWSKQKGSEATLETLLEALYIGDEVELVEDICEKLVGMKISDERKVDPQPVVVTQEVPFEMAVPHKAMQEDEMISPQPFQSEDRENAFFKPVRVSSSGNIKPPVQRLSSESGMVKPVSATEDRGDHTAIAWPTQTGMASHLLYDKKQLLGISPPGGAASPTSSIQVEDGALQNSLTFQGDTSSPQMILEARMNELERKMEEMGIELRGEDAKLRQQIEDLEEKLRQKDSMISHLKEELHLSHEVERQLTVEKEQVETSNEELQRKVKELNQQLLEREAQIERLKEEKSKRVSQEEVDNSGVGKSHLSFTHSEDGGEGADKQDINSDEDTGLVTNWKLERNNILGGGNFGIVYKGHCRDSGRELAVKMVRDLDEKMIQSLEQEYKMLSKLRHKRIVSYLGVCYEKHPSLGKECLFVMTEFMPGGSLSGYYEEKGALNETLTRRYTRQILEGAQYLHGQDIIHRDIKGSNIMRDTRGHVKLADFGSAKKIFAETSEEKRTSYLYGTAPWAAPEVLRSKSADCKSDIWSIAATVVEMMTAEHPYKSNPKIGNSSSTIIYLVGGEKLTPLESTSVKKLQEESLTKEAVRFLTECFKCAPDDRPTASELLQDFNFCQNERH